LFIRGSGWPMLPGFRFRPFRALVPSLMPVQRLGIEGAEEAAEK
jgi:hypothetical protein